MSRLYLQALQNLVYEIIIIQHGVMRPHQTAILKHSEFNSILANYNFSC